MRPQNKKKSPTFFKITFSNFCVLRIAELYEKSKMSTPNKYSFSNESFYEYNLKTLVDLNSLKS